MAEVPDDVVKIIGDLVDYASRSSGGELDYKEIDKFKASVINERGRWLADRVSIPAFRSECLKAGLSRAAVEKLVDLLRKGQAGQRQVMRNHIYRPHRFPYPYE